MGLFCYLLGESAPPFAAKINRFWREGLFWLSKYYIQPDQVGFPEYSMPAFDHEHQDVHGAGKNGRPVCCRRIMSDPGV